MAGEAEPAKKVLLPYLQRADELQKHEPLVAYYCRLYAMERGLKIPAKERTKITNALLISLMNQLEKDKKAVQLSSEDNLYVEGFAQNVFAKADKQDRAGRADLNTAKTFYAASIFFEILHQFGPLQPDLEQKQKYAVWKAADIRKALNEGRRPVPGPPGDEEHLFDAVSGTEDAKLPSVTEPSKSSEQRQVIEQDPKGLSRMSSLKSNDSAVFPPQTMQNEYNHHYSGNLDHEVPHQPLDPAFLGYTTSYPGSHTPYAARPDASTSSPSVQAHQYGVGAHLDEYNAQLYNPHYHLQEHGPASIMPNTFAVVNGSPSGSSYPQPTSSQFQNTSFYPSSLNEGFYSSGELESGRVNDASGIERTFSAPAVVKGQESYQPPPEKIAEAQKAARFAVSALAFDDVPTAISYLRQSLELLTNPSAASSHS